MFEKSIKEVIEDIYNTQKDEILKVVSENICDLYGKASIALTYLEEELSGDVPFVVKNFELEQIEVSETVGYPVFFSYDGKDYLSIDIRLLANLGEGLLLLDKKAGESDKTIDKMVCMNAQVELVHSWYEYHLDNEDFVIYSKDELDGDESDEFENSEEDDEEDNSGKTFH